MFVLQFQTGMHLPQVWHLLLCWKRSAGNCSLIRLCNPCDSTNLLWWFVEFVAVKTVICNINVGIKVGKALIFLHSAVVKALVAQMSSDTQNLFFSTSEERNISWAKKKKKTFEGHISDIWPMHQGTQTEWHQILSSKARFKPDFLSYR